MAFSVSTPEIAVSVRGVSKSYILAHNAPRSTLASEALLQSLKKPRARAQSETFWALRDISFDINRGDVVGIIGRNGAGKSTLLKILSRITEPTTGRIDLYGRVGSLLEVATGFHPELTGRENIFLNGAILGMGRREIVREFEAIVAFAEVEKFLDTPVKRYSSGMYVRLAFAIAAHLKPEILIVDEVLAVGDAEFQKKCLGKMQDVAQSGRTVLFVSHNIAAVQGLCNRGILIQSGRIVFNGDVGEAIMRYQSLGEDAGEAGEQVGSFDLSTRVNPYSDHHLIIRRVSLYNAQGRPVIGVPMGQGLTVVLDVDGFSRNRDTTIEVRLRSDNDQRLAVFNSAMKPFVSRTERQEREQIRLDIPALPLTPGRYWLDIEAVHLEVAILDKVDRAVRLTVFEADVYGNGYALRDGVFFLDGEWNLGHASIAADTLAPVAS